MGIVWDAIKYEKKSPDIAKLLKRFDTILAIDIDRKTIQEENDVPKEIIELAEKRNQARINKDWAESDKLRDEILSKGYMIKDTKEGYEIKK